MKVDEEIQLYKRGVTEIISEEELRKKLIKSEKARRPLIVKLGVDASASDIHLGNAVPIRKLRQFQQNGHKVVFLIGDFTGMIGDPSGRSKTRVPLSKKQVLLNARSFCAQVFKILDKKKTKIVFNSQWCKKMNFEQVINLASRHTVARMLERDDFQNRYKEGNPIGLHEFIYPLVQGYDSVVLKADVEICGTDQKFNCLVARSLQLEWAQAPEVIIMLPLLEGTDGKQKMSKSFGNYIGITESPSQIYGKTMSLPDNLMIKYFELCTDLEEEEIREIKKGLESDKLHPRDVKKKLAFEIVKIYHSASAAEKAQDEFEQVFKHKQLPLNLEQIKVDASWIKENKLWIVDLLVKANLAPSSSEARRLIAQGGVKLDNEKIEDVEARISADKLPFVLKIGKKKFAKIVK